MDVGVFDMDALKVVVVEGVDVGVPVIVLVPVSVGVSEDVNDADWLAESVALEVIEEDVVSDGVPLADAPCDRVDVAEFVAEDDRLLVEDRDSLLVGVCEGVSDDEGVTVPVSVPLLVAVILALSVVEPVPESEPVLEELAPVVTLAVGVTENDTERLVVELGVDDGDGVPVGVTEEVDEPVTESELDTLGVSAAVGGAD